MMMAMTPLGREGRGLPGSRRVGLRDFRGRAGRHDRHPEQYSKRKNDRNTVA